MCVSERVCVCVCVLESERDACLCIQASIWIRNMWIGACMRLHGTTSHCLRECSFITPGGVWHAAAVWRTLGTCGACKPVSRRVTVDKPQWGVGVVGFIWTWWHSVRKQTPLYVGGRGVTSFLSHGGQLSQGSSTSISLFPHLCQGPLTPCSHTPEPPLPLSTTLTYSEIPSKLGHKDIALLMSIIPVA